MNSKKAFLIILDGWGYGQVAKADAIAQANTPYFDHLIKKYPNATLVTHGSQVGLPEGQMGNSEVGHLNIGAGRIVYQELARINKAIEEKVLHKNELLVHTLKKAKERNAAVHMMGLVSDGGVHSHIKHLKAFCDITEEQGLEKVFIHAFMDGRDTDPKGGINYLKDLSEHIEKQAVRISTIIGRYYAMDRDKRWERIKLAYDLMVHSKGEKTNDVFASLKKSYEAGITDEFLQPIVCTDELGNPIAKLENGDLLICFNFRTDRPREISEVLTQNDRPDQRMKKLDLEYLTMTQYDASFKNVEVLFTKNNIANTIGEVLEKAGKTQLRIAETEKYPHVTFFFSGGREEAFNGEKRIMVPSPKVATYDLQPSMSANEITDKVIQDIQEQAADFICLNFANTDMVGHTGDFKAAMVAAETVDSCLERLLPVALSANYDLIIIADHGNSDYMINENGTPNTAHSLNPVPCIYVSETNKGVDLKKGKLADIAPTLLKIIGVDIPKEMDGDVLIHQKKKH